MPSDAILPDVTKPLDNPRHELIAKQLAAGMTQGEIEQRLGVAQGYVSKLLSKNSQIVQRTNETLRQALERRGISADKLAEKIEAGLEAKRVLYATKDGKVSDIVEVDDISERRQHIELAAKLRGDLVDASVNVNVVLDHIPAELEAEMVLTPGEIIDLEAEIVTPQDVETATSSGSGGAKEPPTHPVIAPEMGT